MYRESPPPFFTFSSNKSQVIFPYLTNYNLIDYLQAYPACGPEVNAVGGIFATDRVVTEGNLVTAQAWPDHPRWLRSFLAVWTYLSF